MSILPGPDIVVGVSMMITALMGVYAYRANQKGDQVKTGVATAQTAIDGLAKLADLHAKEIGRIDAKNVECEDARAAMTEKVLRMEGQIGCPEDREHYSGRGGGSGSCRGCLTGSA